MLKFITTLLIFSTITTHLFCQTFSDHKKIEIPQINGDNYFSYRENIKCKNKSIIPLMPVHETNSDSISFLVVDSLHNTSLLHWKVEKDLYGNYSYCNGGGCCLQKNEMILMTWDHLYHVKQKGNTLETYKKIKLPQKENFDFEKILPIYGEASTNNVLLVNTYNYRRSDTVHDIFRLARFNYKKKKIEKTVNIDVGKGIYLSHFSFKWASSTKDNIAIAHPCKPEVYLYDNNLVAKDTIFIDYPAIYKTQTFLDSILPNDFLLDNKPPAYKIIEILNKNKIMRYPKIEQIAFIDDDLLFIYVQPEIDLNASKWTPGKLYFVYSLSKGEFYINEGVKETFSTINRSQPIDFINNYTVNLVDSVDENNQYKYYAAISKISIDFDSKYLSAIDLQKLPDFSALESISLDTTQYDYSDYSYIMVSDYSACAHCKFEDKFENILILHTYQGDEISKSAKLTNQKKYMQMFKNPAVYFCPDSLLNTDSIKLNSIYKIEK